VRSRTFGRRDRHLVSDPFHAELHGLLME
jgi:hypothetical protein